MAFQVPNTLEPLVVSLSVEMLTDVKAVQDVLYAAKLRKFAHSAKLLQALRSEARTEMRDARKRERAPKTLEELVSMIAIDKQTELVHLKETFNLFNTDKAYDATLESHELRSMLLASGANVTLPEVQRMLEDMDLNGDGSVSFVEFAWYSLSCNDMPPEMAASKVFEAIDVDASGVLSVNEIRQAFLNMRSGLDEEELMDIISIFDVGSTGRVERSEFVSKLLEIYREQ
jgi:Ca2+-binding EF-hand superfamily protein